MENDNLQMEKALQSSENDFQVSKWKVIVPENAKKWRSGSELLIIIRNLASYINNEINRQYDLNRFMPITMMVLGDSKMLREI